MKTFTESEKVIRTLRLISYGCERLGMRPEDIRGNQYLMDVCMDAALGDAVRRASVHFEQPEAFIKEHPHMILWGMESIFAEQDRKAEQFVRFVREG